MKEIARPPANLSAHAIGREEELINLHAQLGKTHLPLVVIGVGGLGKTTFSQMYWQRHHAEYDHVAWLSAAALFTGDSGHYEDNAEYFLRAFIDNQALKKNLELTFDPQQRPVEHFRQAIDALAAIEGHNLLVIDNAPEAAAAYLEDLSKLEHWRILFTSRAAIPNTATFRLDTLAPEEAALLYERVYEKTAQSEPLHTILNDIGYHTLTIELLAAYARDKKLESPALLDLLRQKGLARLDDYEVNTPRSAKTQDIAAHLRDVFLLELDAAEKEILRNCCILPTSNVPLDAELVSEDRLCDLFGKKEEETDFKKRLRRLTRMNWLVESEGGYRCHPVIAETAKAQLLPDAVNCAVLIKNVTELLIPDEATNEPGIKRAPFAPLAEAIFKGVWKEKGDFEEVDKVVAILGGWFANLCWHTGNNRKCLEYIEKALSIQEKVLPLDHPDLARLYSNLAETYRALGEYPQSLEYNEKALSIREKVLPMDHPDLAFSYNNLAVTYHAMGDFQKCIEYLEKAFFIREKLLPLDHPDLARSYNNLAVTYGALGEHRKRLEYNEKALAIWENVLPLDHPDLALSYNNLAETYRALGEHRKQLEYNEKALSIREKVLPSDHPDLAQSYNNLAGIYRDIGDLQTCIEYLEKALSIREKVLSSVHPDLARSYNNLAWTYHDLGNIKRAVDYMRKAVVIREKSLPAAHPDTVGSKKSLEIFEQRLKEGKE